jgi:hypothetical protein
MVAVFGDLLRVFLEHRDMANHGLAHSGWHFSRHDGARVLKEKYRTLSPRFDRMDLAIFVRRICAIGKTKLSYCADDCFLYSRIFW